MTATTIRRPPGFAHIAPIGLAAQALWYALGVVVGFLIPFLFSSVLELHHDLYYLIYFALAGAFLGTYCVATRADVVGLFRRNWRLSLALGVIAAVAVVFSVFNQEKATPRPDGLYYGFELLWRGLTYGVVDALLLTGFPVLVAYRVLGNEVRGWVKRGAFAALAFVLMLGITATYHLGYDQFREDGVAKPELGNTIMSIPALLSANPLGAVVAHAAMHIAAVSHAYETEVFLPPQTDAD